MAFKEALRKKMTLDRLARQVELALPAVRKDYQAIDKDLVRRFLAQTPYEPLRLRDLELYRHRGDGRAEEVLVLDNELPLYRNVSPEEVAMRRSPEVSEMLSFKNVKKIMSDRDILVARGAKAIACIHEETVAGLDLRFTAEDIADIVRGGASALEAGRAAELAGEIELLFELLGYQEMERLEGQRLYGRLEPAGYRDVVMLHEGARPGLRLAKGLFAPEDDESMEGLAEVATGVHPADAEGGEVLAFLGREVLRLKAA
jgi:hypothetical protein